MSMQSALSGLNATSSALDAIGNNIANASTVGFKQASPQFADMFAASLGGAGSNQVGMGTTLSTVAQQFSQGSITGTNNPMDVAINGGGFFQMSGTNGTTYTRDGQFQLDQNGYIVDASGNKLQGAYSSTVGAAASNQGSIKIQVGQMQAVTTTNLAVGLNLDARESVPATATFSPNDPTSYNQSTSATVYDSLGVPHTLGMYFVKTGANAWKVYTNIDGGTTPSPATPPAVASLFGPTAFTFDTSGNLLTPAAASPLPKGGVAQNFSVSSGAAPLAFTLNLGASTQFGNSFAVNSVTQDGSAPGDFLGLTISPDGSINGQYSNGKSGTLAQISTYTFPNPNGLTPIGGNQWAPNNSSINGSGPAVPGKPGSGQNGVLQSSAVEGSNVDLTAQLVDMITQQRNYQANAQTIKTEDSIMQTLINLR